MINIMRFIFIDMKKKKVLYVSLFLSIVLLCLYGFMVKNTYRYMNDNVMTQKIISQQIIALGLQMVSFVVSFLSIFLSCGVISSEIENGTLDAVISKPISRAQYYLSKLFVIWIVLIVYTSILFFGIIYLNAHFASCLNIYILNVLKSFLFMILLPLVFSSLGLFLSIYFTSINGGIILIGMYFIATIGSMLERVSGLLNIQRISSEMLNNIGIFVSLLIPSDIICRKSSSVLFTSKSGINFNMIDSIAPMLNPSKIMMIYIILYICFIVQLGCNKFKNKDF